MAFKTFKLKIPLTPVEPPQTFQQDLKVNSGKMISKYGNYFRNAATLTNLPISVLYTIAMIETDGEHYRKNGQVNISGSERSTGIMQQSPDELNYVLRAEMKAGRITTQELAILNKYLYPQLYLGQNIADPPTPKFKEKLFQALKNPEFNIMASAMVFRYLLETTADSDGIMRLDKAIVKYNQGEFSKPTKTIAYKNGDTTSILRINTLSNITQAYIVKAVGMNGGVYFFETNNIN